MSCSVVKRERLKRMAPWAIFGLFLIAFVFLMPGGIAGAVQIARARFLTSKEVIR